MEAGALADEGERVAEVLRHVAVKQVCALEIALAELPDGQGGRLWSEGRHLLQHRVPETPSALERGDCCTRRFFPP